MHEGDYERGDTFLVEPVPVGEDAGVHAMRIQCEDILKSEVTIGADLRDLEIQFLVREGVVDLLKQSASITL